MQVILKKKKFKIFYYNHWTIKTIKLVGMLEYRPSCGAWEPTVARCKKKWPSRGAWEPIKLIFEMLTLCPSLSQAHLRGLVLERSHAALLRSSEHQRSAVGTVHRWRHRHRVSEVRRATPEGDKATSAQSSEHSWHINVLQLPMMQQRVAPAASALVFGPHGLDLDEQLLLRSHINTREQTQITAEQNLN